MVKRSNKSHRKQTRSELRKKKKTQHSAFQHHSTDFLHPSIKAAWNQHKTLQQNYAVLGLITNPNDKQSLDIQQQTISNADIELQPQQLLQIVKDKQQQSSNKHKRKREEDDEEEADTSISSPAVLKVQHELTEIQELSHRSVPAYQVKSMSLNEQRRLQLLISKYGADEQAMARDICLNINQETTSQLKKRIALYQKLQAA